MASERGVEDWVASELSAGLGLSDQEAARVADSCALSPGSAATAVSIARAVARLPEAKAWWDIHGADSTARLVEGGLGDVDAALGEALAPPAPDLIDFNWPPAKVFEVVPIPEGAQRGDEFLVGDGMGGRAWARVVNQTGRAGVVLVPDRKVPNPLAALFLEACADGERLAP